MSLSALIQKGILEPRVGSLINRFQIVKRRDVLIFEELAARYVKLCEDKNKGDRLFKAAQQWAALTMEKLVPKQFKLAPTLSLNTILKRLWINLGLLDGFAVTKKGKIVEVKTRNECVTRLIGKNDFMAGFYSGILSVFYKSTAEYVASEHRGPLNKYTFKLSAPLFDVDSKEKDLYDKLNSSQGGKGYTLKDFLKDTLKLKQNKIYLRDMTLLPIENTVFHLLGNENLLLKELPRLTHNYFKEIFARTDISKQRKFFLAKNFLQATGWGKISIIQRKKRIVIQIKNPPYGLQVEKDNWEFLARVLQGCLWFLDDGLKLKKINVSHKLIHFIYA